MDASDFRDKTHIFSKQRHFFFSDDKTDTFLSTGGSDLFIFLKSEQRALLCRGWLRSVSGLYLSLKLLFILMFNEMETFCLFFGHCFCFMYSQSSG